MSTATVTTAPPASTADGFFSYKGYPLIRKGREIFYGNMSDEYVCMIRIMSVKKIKDLEVADKVKIMLMLTEEGLDMTRAIVKSSDRGSLYEGLDMAYNWLIKTK